MRKIFYLLDALPDEGHHRHRHAVAERLVSGAIRHRFAAMGNGGVIVGEALKAFALARGQAADGGAYGNGLYLTAAGGRLFGQRQRTIIVRFGCLFGSEGDRCADSAYAKSAAATVRRQERVGRTIGAPLKVRFAVTTALHDDHGLGFVILPTHAARVQAVRGIAGGRDQVSGLSLVVVRAACSNACASEGGNCLPRFSARRRMPRQAVALRKYRCGTSPVSSTSDNEHASAALWNSEELSVQNSVGEPIPEFAQPPEDGAKRPSSVNGQDTGDVLPHHPAGPCAISKPEKFQREVATISIQSRSESGDGEVLTGRSSDKKVNWPIFIAFDGREVPMQRDVRIVMRENGARCGFDLAVRSGFPAQRLPSHRAGADACADVEVSHHASPRSRRGEVATATASSSTEAMPSRDMSNQCSAGMLLRCAHDRAVWSETPRSSASRAGPAAVTISECVLIP